MTAALRVLRRIVAALLLDLPAALWRMLTALRRATLATLLLASLTLTAFSLAATVASFTSSAFVGAVSAMASRAGITTVHAGREALRARIARSVAARSARGVTRSLAGTVAQSVPVVGVAAVAGLTAWEIRDYCATIADMRALDPDAAGGDLCTNALAKASALAASAGIDQDWPDRQNAPTDLTALSRDDSPVEDKVGIEP